MEIEISKFTAKIIKNRFPVKITATRYNSYPSGFGGWEIGKMKLVPGQKPERDLTWVDIVEMSSDPVFGNAGGSILFHFFSDKTHLVCILEFAHNIYKKFYYFYHIQVKNAAWRVSRFLRKLRPSYIAHYFRAKRAIRAYKNQLMRDYPGIRL